MSLKIALAQLNPIIGDIQNNKIKAIEEIKKAQENSADLIIFPELFLVGAPLFNICKRYPKIIENNLSALNEITQNNGEINTIIGFAELNKEKYLQNCTALISNQKIIKIFKQAPANTLSAPQDRIFEIKNKKFGLLIGDEFKNPDFIKLFADLKLDYIIVQSNQTTRLNSHYHLQKALKNLTNSKVIFINQTGAVDGLVFAGVSQVLDENSKLLAQAEFLENDALYYIENKNNKIAKIPTGLDFEPKKSFDLNYENDLERTYLSVKKAISQYFKINGFKMAVLGLSGGLDSTISAVLLADALGKENVIGVSMPSKITSDESKNDAKILAQNLGIHFYEVEIKEMVNASKTTFDKPFDYLENKLNTRYKNSLTMDNIQARSRAMILWGISNEFGATLPIATSDKSELYMGYATINGDMSGGFAPLSDITKTKLFALGHWMNKNREQKNAIPENILQKPPGAELAINPKTGKPLCAEEALMPYEFLDETIWRVENLAQNADEMLNEEFLYEKKYKISKEQKNEWLEKFAKRVQSAQFKCGLMPTGAIVDENSISKIEYFQPICAKINF